MGSLHNEKMPSRCLVIVGGGIVGALEAYYAYLEAKRKRQKLRICIYEKSSSFEKGAKTNTAYHIFPSLTPDEILSVVPRGSELIQKLALLFSEPGGIRIDDVVGVNESASAMRFKEAVALYGDDPAHSDRTEHLLKLGKWSMDLWDQLYEEADDELKAIFSESNFHSCYEPDGGEKRALHTGYRIDLIYGMPDAARHADKMRATYEAIGYRYCKILSPGEVIALDPSLIDFCRRHSDGGQWHEGATALWRPGGCISTRVFLPKFYAYLKKAMGSYQDRYGGVQDYFTITFDKEVTEIVFDSEGVHIVALKFADGSIEQFSTRVHYLFCPGETVGTLNRFGFDEPANAAFASPSLFLTIPLSVEIAEKYRTFNHCMEVHKVGIVLAWQARFQNDCLLIGVAGTKAFYGNQAPTIEQAFAMDRNLIQLNMINEVLPDMVTLAYGHDTQGITLGLADLYQLQQKGVLQRWVGRRSVAYDGFPTLGALYHKGRKVANARCTTHLGSGGVAFAPAVVATSRSAEGDASELKSNPLMQKVLHYADSRRMPTSFSS